MKPLIKRQKATAETKAKFAGRDFNWGSVDCAKMVAFHLRRLGHKVPLSKAGNYKTALGAKAALKRLGYANMTEAMDGEGFQRRPSPAFAIIGDVVSLQSDDPIGALGIVLGNGYMLVFHPDYPTAVVMTMNVIDVAWATL